MVAQFLETELTTAPRQLLPSTEKTAIRPVVAVARQGGCMKQACANLADPRPPTVSWSTSIQTDLPSNLSGARREIACETNHGYSAAASEPRDG
jgi:hypothetical protein